MVRQPDNYADRKFIVLDDKVYNLVMIMARGDVRAFEKILTEKFDTEDRLNGSLLLYAPIDDVIDKLIDETPYTNHTARGILVNFKNNSANLKHSVYPNVTLLDYIFQNGTDKAKPFLNSVLNLYNTNEEFAKNISPELKAQAMANAYPITRVAILEKCPSLYQYIPTEEFSQERRMFLNSYDEAVTRYIENGFKQLEYKKADVATIDKFQVDANDLLVLCANKKHNAFKELNNASNEKEEKKLAEQEKTRQAVANEKFRQEMFDSSKHDISKSIETFRAL